MSTLFNFLTIHILDALDPALGLAGVIWDFNRFRDDRRITLQQNPRFYVDLPTCADVCWSEFEAHPFECLRLQDLVDDTIYVLLDGPSRLFLEMEQGPRIFGNVFRPKDALVFEGLCDVSSCLASFLTSC
jgi:hypothetical protein